jgi:hypothetical protein
VATLYVSSFPRVTYFCGNHSLDHYYMIVLSDTDVHAATYPTFTCLVSFFKRRKTLIKFASSLRVVPSLDYHV